jgi:signal transduction histidine kinase
LGERLDAIAANAQRLRGVTVELSQDGRDARVAMAATAFDAVVTHLLNNAIEATLSVSKPGEDSAPPVLIVLRHEARRAVVDIIDNGTGMSPEFVRDALFRPFRTSKPDGSGIGAFQARELLREAGGDLLVTSQPQAGTTMRLLLPLVEAANRQTAETPGRAAQDPHA